MLKRIHIRNYKSLRDVEVKLAPLSVLFGPNAAGKSNFLDALQLLSRIAFSRSLKEAFEPPYRGSPLESFAYGRSGFKELLDSPSKSFSFEADIEISSAVTEIVDREVREFRRTSDEKDDGASQTNGASSYVREQYLRYKVEIEIVPQSGLLRVTDESLAALRNDGDLKSSRNPFLEKVKNRIHLRMERQAHPLQFEPGMDHAILSRPLYAPHYPHLLAARYELASWLFFYFEPRERMRGPNPVKEVRNIGLMGEELAAFLNTLKMVRPKQFEAIEKALHQIVPQVTGVKTEVNQFGEVELKLLENETEMPARLLSEGTLRILGLLAAGSTPQAPGLIGLEEPENGVHPRRIELIAEYLKTRARSGLSQLIVTTHSPTLLDLIPPESLFVVRRKDSQTSISPLPEWGPLSRQAVIDEGLQDEGVRRLSERVVAGELDD